MSTEWSGMAEEPQRHASGGARPEASAIAILDTVPLPPDAHLTESIRVFLRAAVAGGSDDDPQTLSVLALNPLLIALGRLEVDLADARTRIAELEQAVQPRNNRH
jgi:hypothetical protein